MKRYIPFLLIALLQSCIPPSDNYPYKDTALVIQGGQAVSDKLESYIKKWKEGAVSSSIPDSILPDGIKIMKNFYLKNPDDVTSQEAWAVRYAKPIKFDSLYTGLPDPHFTYIYLATPLAPFGSKLVLEGEFPYARFFSIQVTSPMNGKEYYAQRVFGTAEVSWADVDIDPLPGNVNPYREGNNRNATNRKYHVEIDLTTGDPVSLNGEAHKPLYREKGNTRKGGLIVSQGPWGSKNPWLQTIDPEGGEYDMGALWIRVYAPDNGKNALGGVPLPKVWYELPDGRKYFIGSNFSDFIKLANATTKIRTVATGEPNANFGPTVGWFKSWGIVRNIFNGVSQVNGWRHPDSLRRIREVDLGATGRGLNQPAPGNYEAHATVNNYCTYLGRDATVKPGSILVLTGKLPAFPETRSGNSTMTKAQIRYWSIGGYDFDPLGGAPGSAIHSLMDDEVVLDQNRNYIIVYSRPEDRPANAIAANGVTWVNWGTQSNLGLMQRWVSVVPEWSFSKSPHEKNLTWEKTEWSEPTYVNSVIGENTHKGFMACYLPKVHYLSPSEFEVLGNSFKAIDVPVWITEANELGLSAAKNKTANASSIETSNSSVTYGAVNAFDGKLDTRWSSIWSDNPQWISVDLGEVKKISGIKLFWEFSAGTTYQVHVSNNNTDWMSVYSTTGANGGIDVIKNLSASGRYVRVYITKGTLGNYSLYEMEIYVPEIGDCVNEPVAAGFQVPEVPKSKGASPFIVYPNPASTYLKIQSNIPNHFPGALLEVLIYDNHARFIKSQFIKSEDAAINVSDLKEGFYHLSIKFGNIHYYHKIIISKD